MGQSAAHLAHPSPLPPPPPPLFTLPYYYRVYAKAFWSDVAQLEMSPFRKNMPSTAESSTSYSSLRSKRFRASSSRKLEREQKKEFSFFFLLPFQISRYNSTGNACYAGYSYRDNNVPEKCWLNHCPSMQKVNFLLINNWSVSCKKTFVLSFLCIDVGAVHSSRIGFSGENNKKHQ